MNTCPTLEILKQFVAATLADSQADDLCTHLERCPICAERLNALEKSPDEKVVAGFRELLGRKLDADNSLPTKINRYDILEKIGEGAWEPSIALFIRA